MSLRALVALLIVDAIGIPRGSMRLLVWQSSVPSPSRPFRRPVWSRTTIRPSSQLASRPSGPTRQSLRCCDRSQHRCFHRYSEVAVSSIRNIAPLSPATRTGSAKYRLSQLRPSSELVIIWPKRRNRPTTWTSVFPRRNLNSLCSRKLTCLHGGVHFLHWKLGSLSYISE